MKRLLLFFLLFSFRFLMGAQPHGNEWIDPSRVHYRFPVFEDKIYRISYQTLANTIQNFGSLQAKALILYHNGQPVPIYTSTDSTFGPNDYIEFYGKRNRGEMDSLLYHSSDDQINPDYSLFSDASFYYLTTNNKPNNPRYTVVANNIGGNLPPVEKYYMHLMRVVFPTGIYYPGKYYPVQQTETYKSLYDVGEGYTFSQYFGNGAQNFTVFTPNLYPQGPPAIFRSIYANNSYNEDHNVTIALNNTQIYPTPPATQHSYGFQLNHVEVQIPLSQLTNPNTVTYQDNEPGPSSKKDIVGTVSIEYPHDFTFEQSSSYYFNIDASGTNKYIEVTNFDDLGTQPILYDITNGLIYRSAQPAGTYPVKFNLYPSSVKREMLLRANTTNMFGSITQLTPLTFIDFTDPHNQGEYFIITNPTVTNTGGAVEDYRKYRDNVENPISGKFTQARMVDINLLYDQFGYGIRKSPLSIRNFINYLAKDSSINIKLKYVFLVGKGREAPDTRTGTGPGTAYDQCLVPTFGYPGSDNLLAASIDSDTPCVAIGRLAANNDQQVRDYFNKIKLYEEQQNNYSCPTMPEKEWQKQVLHFSGGTTYQEQSMFFYYEQQYQKTIEDSLWGSRVTHYSKTGTNPIDQSQSQIIKEQINNGASWITFFGHSATGAFDFSIDEPENYNNSPKFPIILSNGCFSGFIHDKDPGYSERFVLEADKGAIAFMATSNLSVSDGLNAFSDTLYRNIAVRDYNQPLGQAFKHTLTGLFQQGQPLSDAALEVAYEMTLHGDPGLKPNQYPKPDYAVDATSIYTTPSSITPGLDSFDVDVVVTNLGKTSVNTFGPPLPTSVKRDTIAVSLKRTVFDVNHNPVYYYYKKYVRDPFYKDTIAFKIPVNISTLGYGENLFEPTVDADLKVEEMTECNNTLQTPFTTYIQNDDIIPIYPYEFAIVPNKGVTLKASTVNPFATVRPYRLQIDTSELFVHPLAETVVTQIGGVVHWHTDTSIYKDSTVYYWRVKKDSVGSLWHYSSFIYLAGEDSDGWNQSHYFQYKKDDYQNINLDSTDRVFKFPPNTNTIHVHTGVYPQVDFETLGWDYNNFNEYRYRMGNCDDGNGYPAGITFAVIDSATGQPWVSHNSNGDDWGDKFLNVHCSKHSNDQFGFDFLTTGTHPLGQPWTTLIKQFIDSIPAGNYVLVYSVNQVPYTSWDGTLVQALGQIGFVSTQFTSGNINAPFVFFNQKGHNNNPYNAHGNDYNSPLDVSIVFQKNWFQGNFTSPKIGPAVEWHSVHWQKQSREGGLTKDIDSLDIIGVRTNGVDTVLYTTGNPDNIFNNGGPSISALEYPYLKLRLHTLDDSLYTPTQLYYWRVLYKKPPEAAINPAAHFQFTNQVTQGGHMHLEIGLENVTETPMKKMLTKYTVRDAQLNTYNYYLRYDTLGGLDTMILVLDTLINGSNYVGLDKLIIEANPDNDQIEQYHFNNIAELDFKTVGDKINPLLDVTFDNQHIMNGDIVSAKPNILVMLKDENKFLALNDTSLIQVYIKYPGETTPRLIDFNGVTAKFYPADSTQLSHGNKAQVEINPVFTVDGTYELLVKDRDRSGNNSATTDSRYQGNPATFFDYKTTFEVITKPMITNVLNYPNPFTTSTKFIFTITGSEVPDNMKIQIITIKGTVVKEIFKEELGPLHIGRNITEYAWDGRDQYGDLLANGIYFYHVVTRLDDKRMDQMGMSYDKYFKKGFGKMAIIR